MASPSPEQRERRRLQQQQQQAQQQQQQQQQQAWQWANFINNYPLNILFPAKVSSKDPSKKLKTDQDLINARLLESGILFEDLQKFPDLQPGVFQFVENLNQSGCFHSVQLQLGRPQAAAGTTTSTGEEEPEIRKGSTATATTTTPIHELEVILDEKNWYSLYIGGGFKHDGVEEASTKLMSGGAGGGAGANLMGGLLPKAQFETSATFLNLTGALDQTLLRYTVDQTATSSIVMSHERPLFSWFPEGNDIGTALLALPRGSQYTLGVKTVLDTVDYEWTRSYKESQRLISLQLGNNTSGGRILNTPTEAAPTPNVALGQFVVWNWDWTLALRDVVPRKHATLPYAADASPEIVALSGPTMTNSMTYQIRTNGSQVDHRYQPTSGFDWHGKIQVAGPPGDVGFCKVQGGCAVHVPLWTTTATPEAISEKNTPVTTMTQPPISFHALALHASISGGLLQPLHFGGMCRPPTISDRFFVGGPLQLRGFLPAGIGPRAKTGGSMTPGGDALGGTLFYTGTVAASMAVLPTALQEYTGSAGGGLRVFCFVNAGTVVGGGGGTMSSSSIVTKDSIQGLPFQAIVNSTRVSTGLGLSLGTPMGRLEATYAWPLRYGPRDARSNLQFGMGFHFG
jgi:hypothetical protein